MLSMMLDILPEPLGLLISDVRQSGSGPGRSSLARRSVAGPLDQLRAHGAMGALVGFVCSRAGAGPVRRELRERGVTLSTWVVQGDGSALGVSAGHAPVGVVEVA